MSTTATATAPAPAKSASPAKGPAHQVVTRDQWLAARQTLLKKEKETTRLLDQLGAERRSLPWVKVDKDYVFDAPGGGKVTLDGLFAGRSQLVVYHFMFGPDWQEGCPSCSYVSDHHDAALPHLAARDVTLVAVSRAPIAKLEAFKKRMGWHFNWVSSFHNDFNTDYHVSFTKEEHARGPVEYNYALQEFPSEEAPGLSIFFKDAAGDIYHTYSTYSRGLDQFLGTYRILDLVPKGRDETALDFPMAWVRYRDKYETTQGAFADADKPYWPDANASADEKAAPSSSSCGCGSSSVKREA